MANPYQNGGKIKVVPVVNEAQRYEELLRSGGIPPCFLNRGSYWG